MATILLAEDDDNLRLLTKTILELAGHQVHSHPNGMRALDAFEELRPDLVISDINMPILNGFGLLDGVRQRASGAVVPFLFLSGRSEYEDIRQARRLGADDFLAKPFEPEELVDAVRTRLERHKTIELFNTHSAHLQTIIMLANVIEARDPYTRGHVERVQKYATELAQRLGWTLEALAILEYGALLHDIGKVSVPEHILNKASRLTDDEMEVIKQHTTAGARVLEGITHLHQAMPYVLYHHEKWDGTGYPEGLAGENIPLEGRLLAVVDVFDALTSERPYRKGMPIQEALEIIRKDAGTHFDPRMAEVFIEIQQEKLDKKEK